MLTLNFNTFFFYFHQQTEDLKNRPRLKLQPRTVKDPVNDIADKTQQMSIFGGAKPRDEAKYEKKQADKESKE